MNVAELWRYPVKSLRGERLLVADVAARRRSPATVWCTSASSPGASITSRFRPRLLGLQGSLGDDGEPLVEGLPWTAAGARELVRSAAGPGVELVRFHGADHGQRTTCCRSRC